MAVSPKRRTPRRLWRKLILWVAYKEAVGCDTKKGPPQHFGSVLAVAISRPPRRKFEIRWLRCVAEAGILVILPRLPIVLRHFSVPAQDETMAPLGSHERDRSLSGIERWMRRRTRLKRKARNRPLRLRVAPRMRQRACPEPPARNRPLRVRAASPTAIPPKSGATGSSVGSVRAGSDGSILLTTTTSTARSPSRCQTPNESLAPRMWRRF